MLTDATPTPRIVVLLAVLAVLPYLNALPAGFTYDDFPYIVRNAVVTGGVDPIGTLASPLGNQYRPLTVLTFALNEAAMPGNAAAFHAVNIVLHACVTLLVFAFANQLFRCRQIAAMAAVLFAVHAVHTEAVTSVVGRAELLAGLFGLAALLSAAKLDGAVTSWARVAWQSVSLASFAAALLSKESAITVLPLIPAYRVACRAQSAGRGLWSEVCSLDWFPYAACALVFFVLRWHVDAAASVSLAPTPLYNVLAVVPWTVRIRSALGVVWDYFGLLNFPLALSADYSYKQVPVVTSWVAPRFLAGALLVVAAAVAVARHPQRAVRFAAVFPFAALAVTGNVLFPIGTVKAERLLYLPSVGWALLTAYGFDRLFHDPRYRRIAACALCLMLASFVVRTWNRNWDWQNNATLYRSMARDAPDSAKAQYNWGVALLVDYADYPRAAAQFERAFAIYPGPDVAIGLGLALEKQAHIEEAIDWYETALRIEPTSTEAHTTLCGALLRSRRFEAAIRACRRGLRYHPSDTNLLKGLGRSLIGMGATDTGTQVLRRALLLDGRDNDLRTYLSQLVLVAPGGARQQ